VIAMTNADSLLALLAERSQRLRQPAAGSPATEKKSDPPAARKNGEFSENFSVENSSNTLSNNNNPEFSPFLRSPGDRINTHTHASAGGGARGRAFNSIYFLRNRGETEKIPEISRNSAEPGGSVFSERHGEFSEKSEKAPVCCICSNPITEPVDTFWGADPAHRPCAETAFQANKAASRYKP